MKHEREIAQINACMTYSKEEMDFAKVVAEEIKDPELDSKIEAAKASIGNVTAYLASKTDPKLG